MSSQVQRIGFLLIPGFALTSFSLAVEALTVANTLSNSPLYELTLYSGDGSSDTVLSSNQISVQTQQFFSEATLDCTTLFVCAFRQAALYQNSSVLKKLSQLHRRHCRLAALSGGSFILARAGLLDNLGCTVAYEQRAAFQELYPSTVLQENFFTVNQDILSCAGGISALDMVLYMIARDHGYDFSARVSEQFLQDRMRSETEMHRSIRYLRLRMKSETLGAAVEVMEGNIEQPYSIARLANKIGTTTRTLENVFRRHEGMPPGYYYLKLRLAHAKKMVEETRLPFSTIAQTTGFSSQSYFAKCFRAIYGQSPSELRREQYNRA